jgi:NAD+ diphosphatase
MTSFPPLPWPAAVLDRGSSRRVEPGFLENVLAGTSTRVMVITGGKTLVRDGRIVLFPPAQLADPELVVFLGRPLSTDRLQEDAEPAGDLVLMSIPEERAAELAATAPTGADWAGFREVAASLDALDAGAFLEALAIVNWHRTHTHCPRCGAATNIEAGGWVRRCPVDASEHFPRTDPAIIVAVVGKDDRILLGGGSTWGSNRYSTLAGFVEPGESLEQAVIREVGEEVGVRLHTPTYLGSQPWPFPASLMLGFTALTDDEVPTPDGVEVVRARWFSRDELQAAVLSGEVVISPRVSIARALIENWYGGTIEDAPSGEQFTEPGSAVGQGAGETAASAAAGGTAGGK